MRGTTRFTWPVRWPVTVLNDGVARGGLRRHIDADKANAVVIFVDA